MSFAGVRPKSFHSLQERCALWIQSNISLALIRRKYISALVRAQIQARNLRHYSHSWYGTTFTFLKKTRSVLCRHAQSTVSAPVAASIWQKEKLQPHYVYSSFTFAYDIGTAPRLDPRVEMTSSVITPSSREGVRWEPVSLRCRPGRRGLTVTRSRCFQTYLQPCEVALTNILARTSIQ